jgi:ABC-type amino acid transport substrate-binding protein
LLSWQAVAEVVQDKRILIRVGASPHEPFFFEEENRGLTVDLISAMNQVQKKYRFEIIKVPAKRAFQFADREWVDVLSWDNPKWGWKENHPVESSIPLIDEKDLFVTLKKGMRDQRYFDELSDKRLALINGYHYHFADFETSYEKLSKVYNIDLVKTEYSALQMIVSGRADVTVTSQSSLAWYLEQHPEAAENFLISKKYDSQYQRYFLLVKHAPIQINEINQILKQLAVDGVLLRLYQKYGLSPPIYS